jgi:hypothetical protein
MDPTDLLRSASGLLREQGRLIRLPEDRTVVFVGDTHGDSGASERVLSQFLGSENVIVFLGDYVDRGPDSVGNLALLLEAKLTHPEGLFLLMGNHEAWSVSPFSPADFWESLEPQAERDYAQTLALLPFAAHHPRQVLAVHGGLPDVGSIDQIERLRPGSTNWRAVTWGDWEDAPGYILDPGSFGRPTFGRDYFQEVCDRLDLSLLVRSHQPFAPIYLFADRCLTLFTSSAYGRPERQVAVLRPEGPFRSARDLELVTL